MRAAAALVLCGAVLTLAGCGGNGAANAIVSAVKADPESARAAEANVSAALPSTALYFTDHATYEGMTVDQLRTYDPGLSATISVHDLSATSFCLESTVRAATASVTGPTGAVTDAACA